MFRAVVSLDEASAATFRTPGFLVADLFRTTVFRVAGFRDGAFDAATFRGADFRAGDFDAATFRVAGFRVRAFAAELFLAADFFGVGLDAVALDGVGLLEVVDFLAVADLRDAAWDGVFFVDLANAVLLLWSQDCDRLVFGMSQEVHASASSLNAIFGRSGSFLEKWADVVVSHCM